VPRPAPPGGARRLDPKQPRFYTALTTLQLVFTSGTAGLNLPGVVEDDAVVLARVLAGDEDAFAGLVRRYEPRLRLYVTHIVGVAEEARDLVQESFIRVWRNLDQYDSRYRFSTWLFRIAHNLAIRPREAAPAADRLARPRREPTKARRCVLDPGRRAAQPARHTSRTGRLARSLARADPGPASGLPGARDAAPSRRPVVCGNC